jgi:hypothetical protein
MAKRYRLQELYSLIGGKRLTECCAVVHDFADKILDRTLYRGTGKMSRAAVVSRAAVLWSRGRGGGQGAAVVSRGGGGVKGPRWCQRAAVVSRAEVVSRGEVQECSRRSVQI